MSNHKILVTGAGGFVGSRIVEAVYRLEFGTVRAGIHRWASAARYARFPVESVLCDLSDPVQLHDACQGVTAVVHCAHGGTHDSIVSGTRHLLEASRQAGVKRFVFLSSAEVYGKDASGEVDEEHPCRPLPGSYGDWKREAEEVVAAYQRQGLPTTVLRPAIIYGPFSSSWTMRVADRLQSGAWGTFEEFGEGICNLVYVDDLVRFILRTIEDDGAVGMTFNVVGPERPTWNEYFRQFNLALGLPPLKTIGKAQATRKARSRDRLGRFTGYFVARFKDQLMPIYLRGGTAGRLMKSVKSRLTTTATSAELEGLYSRKATLVTTRAEAAIAFQPSVSMSEGLRRTRDWLAFNGYVRGHPATALPGRDHS